jgi:kinesin family protein 2/24
MPPSARKDATRKKIEQMELEREERRKEMIQRKEARKHEKLKNIAEGNPGDIDFIGMVSEWRKKQQMDYKKEQHKQEPETNSGNICIAVRKRPVSDKERQKLDHDSVSCFPPKIWIHSAKFKVDGISKYITHNSFQLDHAFGEGATTQNIYAATTLPLVDHVVTTQGRATVFCYGQTGSGKTYTMNGIQQILAYDLYGQLQEEHLDVSVAFFELYGGFVQDLLHNRQRCKLLEDGKGEVNITGLQEVSAPTPEDFLQAIEEGNRYVVYRMCFDPPPNMRCIVAPCSSSSHSPLFFPALVPLIPQKPMTPRPDPMPFVKSFCVTRTANSAANSVWSIWRVANVAVIPNRTIRNVAPNPPKSIPHC